MTTPTRVSRLGDVIAAATARRCAGHHGDRLRAIILTGSLARDEATWRTDGRDAARILGDAEFLVVLGDRAPLPDPELVRALTSDLEADLASQGIRCPVTLSHVHAAYLHRLPPTIFAYELRACGRAVWGDPAVRSLVRGFTPSAIPLEDGWRLLCNRLVEHLDPISDGTTVDRRERALYRVVKLYLDMATSLLLFLGAYEPTYRGRAERLRTLAGQPRRGARHPFDLDSFAELVGACTEWKVNGGEWLPADEVSARAAVGRARQLWRWELVQLTGASPDLPDQALLDAWLERQPAGQRIRGWLHLLRKCGWHRSWRSWPRWSRLLRRGSPRHLVYSAACRMLFDPEPAEQDRDPRSFAEPARRAFCDDLPVVRTRPDGQRWLPSPEAAREIAWNYREFLVDTRA
jgi:hypothetical protein